jgi:hypothetical protein
MPWKTKEGNGITLGLPSGADATLRLVWDERGRDVAYVVNQSGEGDVNARLIACAPELILACREVFDAVIDNRRQVPEPVMEAAIRCRMIFVKAIGGTETRADDAAERRRELNKEAQRRRRARMKKNREATDGTPNG